MIQNGNAIYPTVLDQFRSFYLEIIELKRVARAPVMLTAAAGASSGTINVLPDGGRAEEIWRKAAAILDRQSMALIHAGPIEAELQHQARFVMAALADEVFVHPRWEGTDYWLSHLLEARLFQTHSAGDVFFQRLGVLLTRDDPSADPLLALYLMALALGFRGRYAGSVDGDAILQALRLRVYERIRMRNPGLLPEGKLLFPDAYLSTVNEGVPRRLPAPGRWLLIAAGIVALWFLISCILWWVLSGDLNRELPSVKPNATQVDSP